MKEKIGILEARRIATCNYCGRKGHIERNCRSKLKGDEDQENKINFNYRVSKNKENRYFKETEQSTIVKGNERNTRTIIKRIKVEDKEKRAKIIKSNEDERKEIKKLIERYPKVLEVLDRKIEYCTIEKCRIRTPENKKVNKKGQVIPQALRKRTREHIEGLEKRGIIRKSVSEWRNPIRVLEKEDGTIRLVSNLMALNDLVEKDPYQLANIRDVVRAAQGANYLTVLDLKEAFYYIEIEESDKMKTAFEFDGTIYEWNSMVMGFKNSPQILQRVMEKIFNDLKNKGVEIYMDDILIHAETKERHDELINEVLRRLEQNKMRITREKYS